MLSSTMPAARHIIASHSIRQELALLPCAGTRAGTLGCQAAHPHAGRREGPVSRSGRPQLRPGTDRVLCTGLVQTCRVTPCLPKPPILISAAVVHGVRMGPARRCLCCASCWRTGPTSPPPRTTASRRPAAPSSAWTAWSPGGSRLVFGVWSTSWCIMTGSPGMCQPSMGHPQSCVCKSVAACLG
jgi:hypothetical protein